MAEAISQAAGTLGARVRERRQALGLSQEALAHQSGIHWTFLGQVERGQRNISLHNLLKVAAGLRVDPSELVTGLRPPGHPTPTKGSTPP
ncbi:MAG TPA: helix-turn-helix transcriptional regulator [Solirubrobacteraceae bacterium]|jgi:transcriptional regulator with XRE-family HTH domain